MKKIIKYYLIALAILIAIITPGILAMYTDEYYFIYLYIFVLAYPIALMIKPDDNQ